MSSSVSTDDMTIEKTALRVVQAHKSTTEGRRNFNIVENIPPRA